MYEDILIKEAEKQKIRNLWGLTKYLTPEKNLLDSNLNKN